MKRILPWFVNLASRAGIRDVCSALVDPVQNLFSPPYAITLFQFLVLIAQQAGQAAVLGSLSFSLFL